MKKQIINFFQDKTLLFVDDDEILQKEAKNLFGSIFKNVVVAKDGIEGLNSFKSQKFDIVISDIAMPRLNGLDMIKRIRQTDKHTPIIITTAYDDKPLLKKALNLHITSYIEKPFTLDELIKALENAMQIIDNTISEYLDIAKDTKTHTKTLELYYKNKRVNLSPQEKIILNKLIEQKPNPVNYEVLEYVLNSEGFLSIEAIRVAVSSLRKKVPQITIKNVPKVGYCICE